MREVRIALLTNLNFQARAPKKQLGQPPVTGNEGIEDRPYDQPKFLRQDHQKTSEAKKPWQAMRELRIALMTNLNFQAKAPGSLPGNCICEIFIDFNLLFTHIFTCLPMSTNVWKCSSIVFPILGSTTRFLG